MKIDELNKHELQLINEIKDVVCNLISIRARDPQFSFYISDIEIIPMVNYATNQPYQLIRFETKTNNRPLLLGQFGRLKRGGLVGTNQTYFKAYVKGYLMGKYGKKIAERFSIYVDGFPESPSYTKVCSYVSLDNALKHKMVSPTSSLRNLMKRYNLNYLLICGNVISGPSPGMIKALEIVLNRGSYKKILDLFAGTGSYSQVCSQLVDGCGITAVDNQFLRTHNELNKKYGIKFIRKNIFTLQIDESYDLIILDPFYPDSLRVTKETIPNLAKRSNTFLFHLAQIEHRYWISTNLKLLNTHFTKIDQMQVCGSFIVFCKN